MKILYVSAAITVVMYGYAAFSLFWRRRGQ